jgi:hypothetical protein
VILAVGRRFLSDPGSEVGVVRRFRDPPADPASPSYEEIGAALEMPIGAIGPTRARCLDKLRRSLALAQVDLR